MLRVVKDEIGQEDQVEFPLLNVAVAVAAAFVHNLKQRIWRCTPSEPLVSCMSRVSGRRRLVLCKRLTLATAVATSSESSEAMFRSMFLAMLLTKAGSGKSEMTT